MSHEQALAIFENFKIRRTYDEEAETWYFSIVDIVAALIQQPDYQTARKYWNKLKERLKKEGSQTVTNCHKLKLVAGDGKMRLTDEAKLTGRDVTTVSHAVGRLRKRLLNDKD